MLIQGLKFFNIDHIYLSDYKVNDVLVMQTQAINRRLQSPSFTFVTLKITIDKVSDLGLIFIVPSTNILEEVNPKFEPFWIIECSEEKLFHRPTQGVLVYF